MKNSKKDFFSLLLAQILFYAILGILILSVAFNRKLIASALCTGIFFLSLFSYIFVLAKSRKREPSYLVLGKNITKSEFLVIVIIFSFCSLILIQILKRIEILTFLFGGLFILILVGLLSTYIDKLRARKKLPKLLSKLSKDSTLADFKSVISALITTDNYAQAAKYADEALNNFPNDVVLITMASSIYRYLQEYKQAVELIRKAHEISPKDNAVKREILNLKNLRIRVFNM